MTNTTIYDKGKTPGFDEGLSNERKPNSHLDFPWSSWYLQPWREILPYKLIFRAY